MAIFKRGEVYYFEFVYGGRRYCRSTKVKNQRIAGEIERAFRTSLAKGDVGIVERRKIPTFQEFSKTFMDAIRVRSADKPATVGFTLIGQYGCSNMALCGKQGLMRLMRHSLSAM